jgi:hypothetical protein
MLTTAQLRALPAGPPVHLPSTVGWDPRAAPCERTDAEGHVVPSPMDDRGEPEDPSCPPHRVHDAPEVEALRRKLARHNGIVGLEIFHPGDDPVEIVRVYRRDGFVVVADCLDQTQLASLRSGWSRALGQILAAPADAGRRHMHETGRLPHRYSYGSSAATRQQSGWLEWASLVDIPTTTPVLAEIFGGMERYIVAGMGGEVCLPGAMEYQRLHMDGAEPSQMPVERASHAHVLSEQLSQLRLQGTDPRGSGVGTGGRDSKSAGHLPNSLAWQRRAVELTPCGLTIAHAPSIVSSGIAAEELPDLGCTPGHMLFGSGLVTINFLVSDMTTENGPIRQIPGSHTSTQPIPRPSDEPPWMKYSTLVGAKAGT